MPTSKRPPEPRKIPAGEAPPVRRGRPPAGIYAKIVSLLNELVPGEGVEVPLEFTDAPDIATLRNRLQSLVRREYVRTPPPGCRYSVKTLQNGSAAIYLVRDERAER